MFTALYVMLFAAAGFLATCAPLWMALILCGAALFLAYRHEVKSAARKVNLSRRQTTST